MGDKKSAYLAGPMDGHTVSEALNWRLEFREKHSEHFHFFIPGLAEGLNVLEYSKMIEHSDTKRGVSVVGLDYALVSSSDILIANVDYAYKKGTGTMCEIAWAYSMRKPVIIVRHEDNVFNTPFLNEQATAVVETLDEAADLLMTLVGK